MGNREVAVRSRSTVLSKVFVCLLICNASVAASGADGGRSAADFLRIGFGARSAGLGGAYTALCDGAEAVYWNPAAVSDVEASGEVAFGHIAWYQDINVEHGAAAFRLSDDIALGGSMSFLSYGDIPGYGIDGSPTNSPISAYDLSGGLTLSARINDNIAIGLGAKMISQRLDDISAKGTALDAGVKLSSGDFSLAAVLANIGPDIDFQGKKEPLPTAVRLGLAWDPSNLAIFTLEAEKLEKGDAVLRQGVELDFSGQYFLRVGLRLDRGGNRDHVSGRAAFGCGLRLGGTEVNYAFSPGDQLAGELLHRFSVGFSIGQ